jgi:hypothetical protein
MDGLLVRVACSSILHLSTSLELPDWQDERPPTPSYLRILYLGKMLQDEDTLSSASFLLSFLLPCFAISYSLHDP